MRSASTLSFLALLLVGVAVAAYVTTIHYFYPPGGVIVAKINSTPWTEKYFGSGTQLVEAIDRPARYKIRINGEKHSHWIVLPKEDWDALSVGDLWSPGSSRWYEFETYPVTSDPATH